MTTDELDIDPLRTPGAFAKRLCGYCGQRSATAIEINRLARATETSVSPATLDPVDVSPDAASDGKFKRDRTVTRNPVDPLQGAAASRSIGPGSSGTALSL
jgi:hypothetical protein